MKIKSIQTLFIFSNRIFRYRKDTLSEAELIQLNKTRARLKTIIGSQKRGRVSVQIEHEVNDLNKFLLKIGGKIYPKTFWIDNIEVGLVALIIVIGIRSFFFQPFIIPTNSMYPTYSGMRPHVYNLDHPESGKTARLLNSLKLGSKKYYIKSPIAGRVTIPFFSQAKFSKDSRLRSQGFVYFKLVEGRKWFGLLPTTLREYTLYVGQSSVNIRVPLDFSLDEVILQTYFKDHSSIKNLLSDYYSQKRIDLSVDTRHRIRTSTIVKKGDAIIYFDINSGDALFVDRVSYHFIKPKIGDPFVFKTGNIKVEENSSQSLGDKYYIKRLAGIGGETLSIKSNELYANNNRRNEVDAFIKNSKMVDGYLGYQAIGFLDEGKIVDIPEGHYYALGDNSYNSFDSRYWGNVPKESLIGKALFIYYPFTNRWGIAE